MRMMLALLLAPLPALHGSAAPTRKPNIVFILADDLGWSDVSCNGQKLWTPPNIDRIAAGGMRFTRTYAASPVCSPTCASILTGKYPHRLGMTGILDMADRPYKVPDNAAVLPVKSEAQLPAGRLGLVVTEADQGKLWSLPELGPGVPLFQTLTTFL
jgi:hypothetical protein